MHVRNRATHWRLIGLIAGLSVVNFLSSCSGSKGSGTKPTNTSGLTEAVPIPFGDAGTDSFTNPNNIPTIDTRFSSASYTRQIDVKEYGAKGDAATDDTSAIQAALNSASGSGNTRVVFPCSSTPYLIGSTLTYGAQTWIDAASPHCATLRVKSGLGQTIIMLKPTAAGQQGSRISNIVLDQAADVYTTYSAVTQCLSVDGTIGATVDNVEFENIMTVGIWADSVAGAPTKKLTLRNNRVDNALGDGFALTGTLVDILVQGNILENTEDDAIGVHEDANGSPTGVNVVGNIVRAANVRNSAGSTPHCYLIFGSVTNFTLDGNTCNGSVASGIAISNDGASRPSQGSLTGNVVSNAGITGSSTAGVPGEGYYIIGADHVSLSGNIASASRESGFYVFNSTDIALSGNTSYLNGFAGYTIEASQIVPVSGNNATDNGSGGTTPYGFLIINDGAGAGQFVDKLTMGLNTATDTRSGGVRTQTYGFFIAGDNSGVLRVAFNNFQNNLTGALGGLNPPSLMRFENDGDVTISSLVDGIVIPYMALGSGPFQQIAQLFGAWRSRLKPTDEPAVLTDSDLNQSSVSVSSARLLIQNSCVNANPGSQVAETMNGGSVSLNVTYFGVSVGLNGTVSVDGNRTNGSYRATGPCGSDGGMWTEQKMPQIGGAYSGTLTSNSSPTQHIPVQGTIAADASYELSGNTAISSVCFNNLTFTGFQVGAAATLTGTDSFGRTVSFELMSNDSSSSNLTGTYHVNSGPCAGDAGSVTLTKIDSVLTIPTGTNR